VRASVFYYETVGSLKIEETLVDDSSTYTLESFPLSLGGRGAQIGVQCG
jgi:hypothetical protein